MDEDNLLRKAAEKMWLEKDNCDLDFYDPNEDDDNERWVRQHRERLRIIPPLKVSDDSGDAIKSGGKGRGAKINDDNETDAVLSCPACMSLLTRDCQRHEFYKNQYRAIFVENCKVMTDRVLFLPKHDKKLKRKKPGSGPKSNEYLTPLNVKGISKEDLFYPVHCSVCTLNVGVIDHEEVYHFFDVLAGYA
uniref:E2F-associated phosphoprotein n=1 Tax=Syphacia muris TaxID=451379 RepID=A0A158R4T2_9BILA